MAEPERRTGRKVLAVVLAVFAVGMIVQVDWGVMLSGNEDQIQNEVAHGSGLAWLIGPLALWGAFRLAKSGWRSEG
jgi:hypothetical protein